MKASSAVLNFVLHPLRQSDLNLPLKLNGETLTDKAASAIALIESGELSVERARALGSAMVEAAKLREFDQHESRIATLEVATRGRQRE